MEGRAPSSVIEISEEWSETAISIVNSSSPPVVLVCGARNCGKTTFSRNLLNTFLLLSRYNKIAYLDTDVGQAEFTPPGFISLTLIDQITPDLAIPYLKTPERSLFYGDISPKRNPAMYTAYVFALCDFYKSHYCNSNETETECVPEIPLVINTPGWVKGVGFNVLVDTIKHASPSHVVKLNISSGSKNLPPGAFWQNSELGPELEPGEGSSQILIEISAVCHENWRKMALIQKNSRLLRELRLMAYFRQCFPGSKSISTIKELAYALCSHPPYEIDISNVKYKHIHDEVPESDVFYSLNASIVGLAIRSEDSEDYPWCVGLGIVRSVDREKQMLYVITPVPQTTLENVDVILQGYIHIPDCLLQERGCMSPYMTSGVVETCV